MFVGKVCGEFDVVLSGFGIVGWRIFDLVYVLVFEIVVGGDDFRKYVELVDVVGEEDGFEVFDVDIVGGVGFEMCVEVGELLFEFEELEVDVVGEE